MLTKLKKRQEGFTIIEVLIVLAIAALILLIVFFAVPQLQRNSRNTQRNSDAARILQSENECLNNHNYAILACATTAQIGFNASEMGLLSTPPTITALNTPQGTITQAVIHVGWDCGPGGDVVGSASTRSTAVTYQLETGSGTSNKCIKS